jgi:hypothetical protein
VLLLAVIALFGNKGSCASDRVQLDLADPLRLVLKRASAKK